MTPSRALIPLLLLLLLAGCAAFRPQVAPPAAAARQTAGNLPPLGPGRVLAPGIRVHEVSLPRAPRPMKVWVYLPDDGRTTPLPAVLIAPAGTRLFHGMELGDGDRPEHLPYVRAGFAVVAYELDGPLGDNLTDAQVLAAAQAFKNAEAGVANARAALAYVRAKAPRIDPERVYTAGHSSAATTSLLVAQRVPGIRGCIAFAPVAYLEPRLGEDVITLFERFIPGYRQFIRGSSPSQNAASLRCPTFLFHAADDSNVPVQESEQFAALLKRTNPKVTFVRVPTGNHYDSMIRQGIPAAIQWLRTQEMGK